MPPQRIRECIEMIVGDCSDGGVYETMNLGLGSVYLYSCAFSGSFLQLLARCGEICVVVPFEDDQISRRLEKSRRILASVEHLARTAQTVLGSSTHDTLSLRCDSV